MKAITVSMGVSAVSNISFFCWITSSIGFFLVLDRCLIACSVEKKKMYAKLSLEKSKGFLFLSILTYPAFLICLFVSFFALHILPCVYTVTTIMFIPPLFLSMASQYKM